MLPSLLHCTCTWQLCTPELPCLALCARWHRPVAPAQAPCGLAGASSRRPARRPLCKHRRGASTGSHPCCTAHAHGCFALQNCRALHYAPDGTGRWLLPRLPVVSPGRRLAGRRDDHCASTDAGQAQAPIPAALHMHMAALHSRTAVPCTMRQMAQAGGSCPGSLWSRRGVVSPGALRPHCATHLAMRARVPIPHPAASAHPPGAI